MVNEGERSSSEFLNCYRLQEIKWSGYDFSQALLQVGNMFKVNSKDTGKGLFWCLYC